MSKVALVTGAAQGLGLAIAQRIVALHGGELGVKNTGNGTRFNFSLAENPP